jgi:hypothetical protein
VGVLALLAVPAATRAAAPAGPPDILVSRQLLAKAGLSIGDVVTLASDASGSRTRQFRIAGVYEPTPDPMKFNVERMEARRRSRTGDTRTGDRIAGRASGKRPC